MAQADACASVCYQNKAVINKFSVTGAKSQNLDFQDLGMFGYHVPSPHQRKRPLVLTKKNKFSNHDSLHFLPLRVS